MSALLVLGPKRLSAAGRSRGTGLREFGDGVTGRDRREETEQFEPAAASQT